MIKKPTFVGFSTVDRRSPTYTLTDVELVKQDLLNVFLTIRGERVMRPEYGSTIHELLYNPLDEYSRQVITDDVERIISADPRVKLNDTRITEYNHGILVELILTFLPSQNRDLLAVRFEKNTSESA